MSQTSKHPTAAAMARRMRAVMRDLGINQTELGKRLGISPSRVSQLLAKRVELGQASRPVVMLLEGLEDEAKRAQAT